MNPDSPQTDATLQRQYRVRVALFLLVVVAFLIALNTGFKAANTLRVLKIVETERDEWQRPRDVISALNLREGDAVADIGSGAGYFTLKLSPLVGTSGRVIAIDVLKLPLFFLWTRSFLAGGRNIHVSLGSSDDPRLPSGSVDAILVANTYHEFRNPLRMLDHMSDSLRVGGLLALLDRGRAAAAEDEDGHHQLSSQIVYEQLRQKGFEILKRDDQFIARPNGEQWWLIVCRKPKTFQ